MLRIHFFQKRSVIAALCLTAAVLFALFAAPVGMRAASSAAKNGAEEGAPSSDASPEKSFIKWVDFNVPYQAMEDALTIDIQSHDEDVPYHWVELLACLATEYGGNWKLYKRSDLEKLTQALADGRGADELMKGKKYYAYFREAYGAVLDEFVGYYEEETPDEENPEQTAIAPQYGMKVFSPIARGYSFSHYDDFGNSRSYGYRRKHLGHDLMGSVGTPVVAVESGTVECVGWNRYGGWRIGIRSFDSKRYYYYAHLRKNHPYNNICEGKVVRAGDVIGYMGMTGYSTKENVNNIDTPHLHFGMQLIFDESQKDGSGEIWIDLYAITQLLQKHQSAVQRDAEKNEYNRKYWFTEPSLGDWQSKKSAEAPQNNVG